MDVSILVNLFDIHNEAALLTIDKLKPDRVIFIIDDVSFLDYIFKPGTAFPALVDKAQSLQIVDIVILSGGLGGAIVAGFVMIALRKAGYRMF